MPKTLAVLLITLVVSMLGVALAYLVGQRTAEFRMRSEIERSRLEQKALVDELRRELAPPRELAARPVEIAASSPGANPPAAVAQREETAPVAEPMAQNPDSGVETPSVAPLAMARKETEAAPEDVATAVSREASAPEPSAEPAAPETAQEMPPVAGEESPGLSPDAPPAPPIARESFDAVLLGTLYTDVAQRFGRDGLAALTMQDATGTETKHYFWDWIGSAGQACRVSMRFVDGRLTDKIYRD